MGTVVTAERVDVAGHFSESPWTTVEKVVDHFRKQSKQQACIADSQVQEEHIGRSSQYRRAAEDTQYTVVAEGGDEAF